MNQHKYILVRAQMKLDEKFMKIIKYAIKMAACDKDRRSDKCYLIRQDPAWAIVCNYMALPNMPEEELRKLEPNRKSLKNY